MNGTCFKTNLRSALTSRGLTVRELSVITGIAKGTLDCYLGVRASMPPADIAAKIATALGVTVEFLVSGGQEAQARESEKRENAIGTVLRLLVELDERDVETVLTVTKVLRTQAERYPASSSAASITRA
ncbi:MAG: helix-turn-helix domain-containing protein [Treponema sp.]|nr:helix-turn-helix domain-containing protein [Treponema sp.]